MKREDPEKLQRMTRAHSLKIQHGISCEEYSQSLRSQAGRCAIYSTDNPGKGKRNFSLDHCHKTGKIRGLLCDKCNRMIGLSGDDAWVLRKAIMYLATADTGLISQTSRGRRRAA